MSYDPSDPYDPYGGQNYGTPDYTGFGATSSGFAPSPGQRRRQAANRAYTSSNMDAMSFIDPYIAEAGERAMRLMHVTGDSAAARRQLYSSGQGQVTRDALMLMRTNGMLGQGNPMTYVSNINQGLSAGGYSQNVFDQYGRQTGFDQRVSGNGMITEQVALRYQKDLLKNIYGEGTPDASKLYGFDMAETSGVAKTLMSRGSGTVMAIKQNASLAERISSARGQTHDREISDALGKVDGNMSEREFLGMGKKMGGKFEAEFNRISSTKNAGIFDEQSGKKFAEVVKTTVKGMANLADIYKELNSEQLLQQMEAFTGTRLTGQSTQKEARHASLLTERLRNAADASGMDPRQFFDMLQKSQVQMIQGVQEAFGFDERGGSTTKNVIAGLSSVSGPRTGYQAKRDTETASRFRTHGWDPGAQVAPEEVAADISQGQVMFSKNYKSVIALQGAAESLPAEQRKHAETLIARFKQASATGTESERRQTNAQIESFLGGIYGGKGGWGAYRETDLFKSHLSSGAKGEKGEAISGMIEDIRRHQYNTSGMENELTHSFGVAPDAARGVAQKILDTTGAGGLASLASIAGNPNDGLSGKERMDAIRKYMSKNAGMSEGEINSMTGMLFDKDGRIKDKDAFRRLAQTTRQTARVDTSMDARNVQAEAEFSVTSEGTHMRDTNGNALSLSGILNKVVTGEFSTNENEDTRALGLEALKGYGVPIMAGGKDISDQIQTGLDVSGGINEDAIAKAMKATGKSRQEVLVAAGFATEDAYKSHASGAEARNKALNGWKENLGLSLTGTPDKMTLTTSAAQDFYQKDGATRLKTAAAFRATGQGGTGNDISAGEQAILSGAKASLDQNKLEVDTTKELKKSSFIGMEKSEGSEHRKYGAKGEHVQKWKELAENITTSKDASGWAALNADGKLGDQLGKEQFALSKFLAISTKDGKVAAKDVTISDGHGHMVKVEETIAKLAAAQAKLAEAADHSDKTMTVGSLEVKGGLHCDYMNQKT